MRLLLCLALACGGSSEEDEVLEAELEAEAAAGSESTEETGLTIVIIEHDMHVVFSLADRITVLAGGRVIAQGSPDEIKGNPKVVEAYLGEEQV